MEQPKNQSRAPSAIVFDVFGTVVDWRSSLVAELTTYGQTPGITADWERLVDAWRGAYVPSMNRVRLGEQPWTKLDDLHRQSLDRLVAEFGIQGLTETDLCHINRGWHRLHPWPDSVPGLLRLKRRYIIGPLSNGNLSLQVDLAKHGGLPWDVVFGSDIFQHYKPDPETYLGACKYLDLAPGQVMLAAAHNDDLAAARANGLMTGFIPRPTEYGPHQSRDFGPEQDWDVVASDMEDLAARLGA
ncbi:MAG: haloacid dehalogenase type II [Acetobacteraceae bacterium]|nr:haloacid dehalogenase type II [Acetobacteraceae bacterium]MBV8521089.1 haloacid dehalogenase type II [Acetobacteraceae bacterium]